MRTAMVIAAALLLAACSQANSNFCATTCMPSCGTMGTSGQAPCMGHIEPDGGSDTCFTQCVSSCGTSGPVAMCTATHAVDCGPTGVAACIPR